MADNYGPRWAEMQERRKRYMDTPGNRSVAHREYYGWLVEVLGPAQLAALLPEQRPSVLRELLAADPHLNNISLPLWDDRNGFVTSLAVRAGIRVWSLSDTVCVLKERARQIAEREEQ